MTDSAHAGLPIHLKTHDPIGIDAIAPLDIAEWPVLVTTYGLFQIICTGLPNLEDKGRAETAIASLVRDATTTIGGGIVMLSKGLYEPTLRVARSLFEARLIAKRLRSDDSERLANLLVVDRLLTRKRGFQAQIERGLRPADDPWIREQLNGIKEILKKDATLTQAEQELRNLKSSGRQWHGAPSIEKLAEELGEGDTYHLLYVPASAYFVHPGDPDTQIQASGSGVRARDIVTTDPERLRTAAQVMINDGHDLLVTATTDWDLPPEVRIAVDLGMHLMRISLGLDLVDEQKLVELEEAGGLKRAAWTGVVKVTFDWDGISQVSSDSTNSET